MINEVRIIGNVGANPEENPGGTVARLSVATSEKYKDRSGQWQEITSWHRVVGFGFAKDSIMKYVKKGMQVYVEGSLSYGKYEKDGVTHYTTDIKARKVKILGRKGDDGPARHEQDYEVQHNDSSQSTGDDVPF